MRPLQHTLEEVRFVARKHDVLLTDSKASEEFLKKELSQEVRWAVVHFACHGIYERDNPALSSLVLSPDARNDGFLTGPEILALPLSAHLVVLSACETARGKLVQGEGIVGFARAFMVAGAPRVICSLWKVDDEATQALMIKFYELWNPKDGKKGLGAAAALKIARPAVCDPVKPTARIAS